jgi:hypothetical protein
LIASLLQDAPFLNGEDIICPLFHFSGMEIIKRIFDVDEVRSKGWYNKALK